MRCALSICEHYLICTVVRLTRFQFEMFHEEGDMEKTKKVLQKRFFFGGILENENKMCQLQTNQELDRDRKNPPEISTFSLF